LFVIVYAENGLLGAHAVSLLPDTTFWWLAADEPVRCVCWLAARTDLGVSRLPRGPAGFGSSARHGLSAPGEQKTGGTRLSRLFHWDQRHLPGELGCRTAGCERNPMPLQVATRVQVHEIDLLRIH
jgi:hypothetical protein